MPCDCWCNVAHTCGTMGWSAVCDYGISWLYSPFGDSSQIGIKAGCSATEASWNIKMLHEATYDLIICRDAG